MEAEDFRNRLLNISIVSAEAKDFIEIQRKSSTELLKIRPTLHLFQVTPFGELKSTLAHRIESYCRTRENHPCHLASHITAPAMAGTIDERYRVILPANVNFLNGTMLVDEFQTNPLQKSETIGCALDVLESERSSRIMGRMPNKPLENKFDRRITYEVKNGRLVFNGLRSNWIFFTAKYLQMNRSLQMAMLMSRTVPILFNPSLDELDAIDDNPDLLFQPLNLNVPKFEVVPNKEYLEIRNFAREKLESLAITENYYFRTINDCVRCYVFSNYQHDFALYEYVINCKASFVSSVEEDGWSIAKLEEAEKCSIS